MISANSGSIFYVGTYDAQTELMTVVGGKQILDASANYQWAAAGTNGPDPESDTGRLLTVAWVKAGGSGRVPCMPDGCPSMLSLIRSISWDAQTQQLVSTPVQEYSLLRNETFVLDQNMGLIPPGSSKPLPVPTGAGSIDILVSFKPVIGAANFGVAVRSGDVKVEVVSVTAAAAAANVDNAAAASTGEHDEKQGRAFARHRVLLNFYSGPQPCVSARGQPKCTAPPAVPPPTNASVEVVAGETLDIRILVDRPIVPTATPVNESVLRVFDSTSRGFHWYCTGI